jgi:hypothetical protein
MIRIMISPIVKDPEFLKGYIVYKVDNTFSRPISSVTSKIDATSMIGATLKYQKIQRIPEIDDISKNLMISMPSEISEIFDIRKTQEIPRVLDTREIHEITKITKIRLINKIIETYKTYYLHKVFEIEQFLPHRTLISLPMEDQRQRQITHSMTFFINLVGWALTFLQSRFQRPTMMVAKSLALVPRSPLKVTSHLQDGEITGRYGINRVMPSLALEDIQSGQNDTSAVFVPISLSILEKWCAMSRLFIKNSWTKMSLASASTVTSQIASSAAMGQKMDSRVATTSLGTSKYTSLNRNEIMGIDNEEDRGHLHRRI